MVDLFLVFIFFFTVSFISIFTVGFFTVILPKLLRRDTAGEYLKSHHSCPRPPLR